ncbi:hypothetical protein ACNAN0_12280 [Agrilactobacillus fermenti]|uniref:hypothetical protein n=1 Tax=Agrilactobacillus fermenti TaxID=2586909 RepID=UPI001E54D649|nr:hypothetical protein [Agrilactobacillus fermenti]MCD2255923.1 hypothetical protein [Agrilactobacillus fermenti]
MKKHRKLFRILGIIFGSLIIIIGLLFAFRRPLLNHAQKFLTAQTIPFNWIVDPNHVANGLDVPEVNLSVTQMDDVKKDALKVVDNINNDFSVAKQNYTFLTGKQARQLDRWVHSKPHQYIYSFTPVAFGRTNTGNYVLVSANRYDDTTTIVSYRYRVYYNAQNAITKTVYMSTVKHNTPPKFVFAQAPVGTDGVSTATNFTERIKNILSKSSAFDNNNGKLAQYRGLAEQLNLATDSAPALQKYLQVSNTDFQNTAIIGYELTDVPRVTRFFLVSGTNRHKTYFTLTYDRDQEGFTKFQRGLINANEQK